MGQGAKTLGLMRLSYVYDTIEQMMWKAIASSIIKELKDGCYEEVFFRVGVILKIAPDGLLSYRMFEYTPFTYDNNWWNYFNKPDTIKFNTEDSDYIFQLKSTAYIYGYIPDGIDYMLDSGFILEDKEETL